MVFYKFIKSQVSNEEGMEFARKTNALFISTSALSGENIEKAFILLSKEVLKLVDGGQIDLKNKVLSISF